MMMFRLAGFPGIELSKQKGWEGCRGLPLIGDVALKLPHRSDVPRAPAHGPRSSSLPWGFRLAPIHGYPIPPHRSLA